MSDPAALPPPLALVVDRDPARIDLLRAALHAAGYRVQAAATWAALDATLDAESPDLVLVRWGLEGLDGPTVCGRARELPAEHYAYVVQLAAEGTAAELTAAREAGADDSLAWPLDPAALGLRLDGWRRGRQREQRLARMARNDALTGVPTRRTFFSDLEREFARSRRYKLSLACAMIDIDFFKRINDSYGHPMGDTVLKVVAQVLQESVRASDVICRYGGEEFCVLLPETTEQDATIWAERLRERVSDLMFPTNVDTLRITISIGLAHNLPELRQAESLIDHADQALLVAKQSGRDRVIRFSLLEGEESDPSRGSALLKLVQHTPARAVMSSPISCLRQEESVLAAADFFCRTRINSAPVVNDAGTMVGIVSEKDVLACLVEPDVAARTVARIMKSNVIAFEESTPVRRIHELLSRVTIRRVIIVRDGVPTGVVSRGNLLRWYRDQLRALRRAEGAPAPGPGEEPLDVSSTVAEARLLVLSEALVADAERLQRQLEGQPAHPQAVVLEGTERLRKALDELLDTARKIRTAPRAAALVE